MRKKKRRNIWRLVLGSLILFYLIGYIGYDSVIEGHKGVYNYGKNVGILAENTLRVTFLDVGQGDCILVQEGDETMLIDCGDNDHGELVVDYLKKHQIENLKYLILTHPDADHIGGADNVLEQMEVSEVLMTEVRNDTNSYRDVLEELAVKKSNIRRPVIGDRYILGDAEFRILAPEQTYMEAEECNNASIGIKLTYGKNTFLLCGDAEEEEESAMVRRFGAELECDVLKCDHHGSNTATSESFLEAADPSWVVISCGEGNPYGHPHREVLERLYEADTQVYRTDELGTIVVESDGVDLRFGQEKTEQL